MSFRPDSPHRRAWLTRTLGLAGGASLGLSAPALALRPRADSPEVGIDPLLADTGLAARWGQAMRRDLGWAARWQASATAQVLAQLESGQIEVGLFLSHPRAAWLEKEGLIHDRRRLARTEVWLVGPASDPAGIRSETDPARAIAQVLAAQAAGVVRWELGLPGGGQPGSQAPPSQRPDSPLAQLLTTLGVAESAHRGAAPVAKATLPTYRLVSQAAWLHQGLASRSGSDTRIWFQGHPALALHAEVARSFRGKHPGARLLVEWLDRPLARAALRGARGWQAPKS